MVLMKKNRKKNFLFLFILVFIPKKKRKTISILNNELVD